jgi:hypothetical protein
MIRLGQKEGNGSKEKNLSVENETFIELKVKILGTQIKTLPRFLT